MKASQKTYSASKEQDLYVSYYTQLSDELPLPIELYLKLEEPYAQKQLENRADTQTQTKISLKPREAISFVKECLQV